MKQKKKIKSTRRGRKPVNHARLECYIDAELRARVCAEPNRGIVIEKALRAYYGLK